jgi:AraC-like DNA-binding protein
MHNHNQPVDGMYDALVSPLKSAGPFIESSQEALVREESEIIGGTIFKRISRGEYRRGLQVLRAGDLTLIVGRTTSAESTNISEEFRCLVTMPAIGGFQKVIEGQIREVIAGDLHLDLNNFTKKSRTCSCSLFIAIDEGRLASTMRTLGSGESLDALGKSVIVKEGGHGPRRSGTSKLWHLINFIDTIHGEDPYLPTALGLGEQFYRLLSVTLLEGADRIGVVRDRWSSKKLNWKSGLDDLVDYLRMNCHVNLTLTDLEEKSNYSARQLQKLFREKLDCTPMQFVRRQRLAFAMERLQTATWDDSVTSIARDCGYRHTSNFTADFQKEFGVAPSVVLRASRGGGGTEIGFEDCGREAPLGST